jgi:hypothetical protein
MKNRQSNFFRVGLFIFTIFLISCSSSNIQIDKGAPLPSVVKTYKHVGVPGGRSGMIDTGVYVNMSDSVSILATGSINYCPQPYCPNTYQNVTPDLGWPLIARVGDEDAHYFRPLVRRSNSGHFSHRQGKLYLGYKTGGLKYNGEPLNPEYYRNDIGGFSVDIIIWANEDYIRIADFLEQQLAKKPKNKALQDELARFNVLKRYRMAELKAKKEAEKTQQEISQLQDKTAGRPASASDRQQVQELAAKLASLQATLTELDRMKQKLQQEQQKSEQLSQQLAEQEQREQQLLSKLSEGVKNPPVLLIATPEHGTRTEAKYVQLSGAVLDETGLEQITIYVNNRKLIPGAGRGIHIVEGSYPRRLDIEQRIALQKGANTIKIHALDTDGLFIEKSITVHHVSRRRNLWAVVVGINDYPNIRPLKYAVADAEAFYDLLVKHNQVPVENVFLLLNEQATLQNLRSTMGTRIKNKAGADDMVIIYFAGHGATERDTMSPDGDGLEKYLLPYGADPNDLYASALPMREVAHIFHRIRSERLVFVADACYSGASGGRTVSITGMRANLSDRFMERLAGGKGKVIITASSANEVSVEKDELGHGVFTYYLVQGLRGPADTDADGLISVDEAYRYVSEKVPAATGQEQHPVKKGSVEGQLVMGIVP